jgi:hypothetical protein
MQGCSGHRGINTQGNVIYLGMEWSYIENLMLGQISKSLVPNNGTAANARSTDKELPEKRSSPK